LVVDMKGISEFTAVIILISFVVAGFLIFQPFIKEVIETEKSKVDEVGESAVECGMGVIHIDDVATGSELKVTVENLGKIELTNLKIVAYNQSGAFTFPANPSSIPVGRKVTLTSQAPLGTVVKVKVITNCPQVYDEYKVE